MDLTMRQVTNLLAVIDRKMLKEIYFEALSYRLATASEFPSLDEFLGVNSEDTESTFDPEMDKRLEEIALKKLLEKKSGR
jgi:hypothetical protein